MLLTTERVRWLRDEGIGVRVTLDGTDVTRDCLVADDAAGFVVLVLRDADGRLRLNADRSAVEQVTGSGRVVLECFELPAPEPEDFGRVI